MENLLSNLEIEITNGQKDAKQAKEIYQLLSTYNSYNILLLKVKEEYERKKLNIKEYYSDSNCYKEKTASLFSLFKSNEYINGKIVSELDSENMLFLIDQNTLLIISSFDIANSPISGLSYINYDLLKINNCKGKIYKQSIYCGDPYYCDQHWEDREAFGFFYNDTLITPAYALDNKFISYDNVDIREILKVQTLDDIHEKMNKAKKLILTK